MSSESTSNGGGATYRHALVERRRTSPTELISSRLKLDRDADMLYLRALHLADERPCIYEERWVHLAAAPGILEVDFETISANEWLVRNMPFSSGDIALSAANASAREAALLETSQGQALFVVERTTWQGECPDYLGADAARAGVPDADDVVTRGSAVRCCKSTWSMHSEVDMVNTETPTPSPGGEVIVYEAPDGEVRVDVRFDRETVWLTQQQMAELFGQDRSVVTRHIRSAFREGELDPEATVTVRSSRGDPCQGRQGTIADSANGAAARSRARWITTTSTWSSPSATASNRCAARSSASGPPARCVTTWSAASRGG